DPRCHARQALPAHPEAGCGKAPLGERPAARRSGGLPHSRARRMNTLVSNLRLAWRLLRRDARAGELRVLAAALIIAVARAGPVAFFPDRVKAGLNAQADKLLGADLMLSGDRPLPISFADEAQRLGLAMVRSVRFNSMVLPAGGDTASPVLAEVRAVTEG